jgi:hypothetical protein
MWRIPVAQNRREQKPVIDAVNDAVSALSDLIRSVRGNRRGKKPTDLKTRAKAAGKEVKAAGKDVKKGARDVGADVRRAGHSLRSRFESAWDALTSNGTAASNGSARLGKGRKSARKSKTRARA